MRRCSRGRAVIGQHVEELQAEEPAFHLQRIDLAWRIGIGRSPASGASAQ